MSRSPTLFRDKSPVRPQRSRQRLRFRRHKLWLLIAVVVVVLAVGGWLVWRSSNSMSAKSEDTAKQFMQAVQKRDAKQAIKYVDNPYDTQQRLVYELIIQRAEKDYQLDSRESREWKDSQQHSYIFKAQGDGSEKFIRLILEPSKDKESWRVVQVFANPTKPSAFPATAPQKTR